jgi:tight adherence protein B
MSAEGRLSGWILALIPFALTAMLTVTSPDYLPVLLEHETGQKMIIGGCVAGLIGILWIRRIIRIDV